MPDFNPDAYLSQKIAAKDQAPAFNPDAYLKAKGAPEAAKEPGLVNSPLGQAVGVAVPALAGLSNPAPAAKAALGFSEGVAENLNLATLPHVGETIFRSFGESADPNKGFFGRVGERLSKAEAKTVTPKLSIPEIAAGARAGLKALMTQQPVGPIYQEELKSQKDYNENFLPAGAKATGEVVAGIANIGMLAKDVVGLLGTSKVGVKAAEALRSGANEKAYDALKPMGKIADKIVNEDRVQAIGEQLLKDKIVDSGSTFKDILARTKSKLNEYGKEIGYFAKTADQAVERDSSLRAIPMKELSNTIQKQIAEPLLNDPSTIQVGQKVTEWLDNFKKLNPQSDLSFERAQQLKGALAKEKVKFQISGDSIARDAYQDIYHALNQAIESGIQTTLEKAAPEITNQFNEAKTAYSNLKDAETLIKNTVSRTNKNRAFSLSDYIMGEAGLAKYGPRGLILAVGNKLARTQGNQAGAAGLQGLASMIESAPKDGPALESLKGAGAINYLLNQIQIQQGMGK